MPNHLSCSVHMLTFLTTTFTANQTLLVDVGLMSGYIPNISVHLITCHVFNGTPAQLERISILR